MTISRVLIANRGEIAVRIIRACQALGIESVLAYSVADRESLPARIADHKVCIGPASATESYLSVGAVIAAAEATGSDAIHPGYGFLAESPELAEACASHGIKFVGPRAEQIRQMGNKIQARILARQFATPTLPGSDRISCFDEAKAIAQRIGPPLIIKAAAGGGGRGMKVVNDIAHLQEVFASASAEARAAFGDDTLYLERFVRNARHVEVQVLGDSFGNLIHLGERDCSLQRRHQKLLEEAPAPNMSEKVREDIRQAAVALARGVKYENAGTVEFVLDQDSGEFYFLEMNTRIQVEHPVTELITRIDIVQEQFRIANGEPLRFTQSDIQFRGHAIECRINAESPDHDFRPSPGTIVEWSPPEGPNIRLDTHSFAGYTVPVFYDSLLAKLLVYGIDRKEAASRMLRALEQFKVGGLHTTIAFQRFLVSHPDFLEGKVTTHMVEEAIPHFAARG